MREILQPECSKLHPELRRLHLNWSRLSEELLVQNQSLSSVHYYRGYSSKRSRHIDRTERIAISREDSNRCRLVHDHPLALPRGRVRNSRAGARSLRKVFRWTFSTIPAGTRHGRFTAGQAKRDISLQEILALVLNNDHLAWILFVCRWGDFEAMDQTLP